jgi:endonuclease/exonuclease/phosphatase family metal-dependent hydrolase
MKFIKNGIIRLVLIIFIASVASGQWCFAKTGNDFSGKKSDTIYDAPDQAIWHAKTRTWFISNLGGGISLKKDNYGWITQTDEKGNVLHAFWIGKKEGMHAPSGMAISENFLYVCDREGVYEINIIKREIKNFIKITGASFINDIAIASNGDLFVSDFYGNKIYKIPNDTRIPEIWIASDKLKSPDGLYVDKNNLIVASWGKLSHPETFETSELGDLLSIDLNSKKVEVILSKIGNLEGITKAEDHYYISDWSAGKILKVDAKQKNVIDFVTGLKNPTDLDYASELNVLAIPQHGTNQVLFVNLSKNYNGQSFSNTQYPIASYNYGGLEKKSPKEQVQLLERFGYNQIVLKSETVEDFKSIDEFILLDSLNSNFKVNAVFERYNFIDSDERKERWKLVVDKIANKKIQLWIIFGKKNEGITNEFIENKLTQISKYAFEKNVEVILYPHSDCYISSAEEALPFVKKINQSNLKLAFHLYHEIRAGNGSRIPAVFEKIKNYLGAVTLAGTDIVPDYTNPKTRDTSTIKPIGYGNFDLVNFILPLKNSTYAGTVAIMNFGITEQPEDYLPRSLLAWERLLSANENHNKKTGSSIPIVANRVLKLMTYNLKFASTTYEPKWEIRREMQVDMIRKYAPDIVATQEGLKEQIDYLMDRLPEYIVIGEGRKGGDDDEHMAIFFKKDKFRLRELQSFQLSKTPDIFGSGPVVNPRMVTWARLAFINRQVEGQKRVYPQDYRDHWENNSEFYVFNTHFFNGPAPIARVSAAKLIMEKIQSLNRFGEWTPERPLFLLGDFNCLPGSMPYQVFTSNKDSANSDMLKNVFEDPKKIDWILYKGPVKVLKYEVVDYNIKSVYPSDHKPIYAEVEIK